MVWRGKLICDLTVCQLEEAIEIYKEHLDRKEVASVRLGLKLLQDELLSRENVSCLT